MVTTIGFYLYVAANATRLPLEWTLPALALGGVCYLAIVWPISRSLYASEFAYIRARSTHRPRVPETFALVALAAWTRSLPMWWSLPTTILITFIAMVTFLRLEKIERPLRATWEQWRRDAKLTKLGSTLTSWRPYIQWVAVPFVLLVLVVPIEVMQKVPTAFPLVSTTLAWSFAFATFLLTIKTLLHIVPKGTDAT